MNRQSNKITQIAQWIYTVVQFKNLIFFCLYILFRPKLLTLLFKRVYLPVYVQYEWLKKFNVGTIVDIGANQGNVTVALAAMFPQANIFAFEPIRTDCNVLKQKVKRLRNVTVINAALSSKNGKVSFFVNTFSPSSSMLALSSLGKKITPPLTKKTTVRAVTLDTYFHDKELKRPIFIKIDVQGVENIVFEGGKDFLKRTSVMHVETGFETVYKNQCLFGDIYQMLIRCGFLYHGNILDVNFYPLFAIPFFENSIFIKKSVIRFIL